MENSWGKFPPPSAPSLFPSSIGFYQSRWGTWVKKKRRKLTYFSLRNFALERFKIKLFCKIKLLSRVLKQVCRRTQLDTALPERVKDVLTSGGRNVKQNAFFWYIFFKTWTSLKALPSFQRFALGGNEGNNYKVFHLGCTDWQRGVVSVPQLYFFVLVVRLLGVKKLYSVRGRLLHRRRQEIGDSKLIASSLWLKEFQSSLEICHEQLGIVWFEPCKFCMH